MDSLCAFIIITMVTHVTSLTEKVKPRQTYSK